ncbi:MAG: hypothetical protein EOO38_06940 [Cytophagaceae bacterium]|nr:MAG: hypothetical protein EOO38_06940 [Cytophagaceae bacterium]
MIRFSVRSFFARILPVQPKPTLTAGRLHMLNRGTSPNIRHFDTVRWLSSVQVAAGPASAAPTALPMGRHRDIERWVDTVPFLALRAPIAAPKPTAALRPSRGHAQLFDAFHTENQAFNAMRQNFRKGPPVAVAPQRTPSVAVSALSDADYDANSLYDVSSLGER